MRRIKSTCNGVTAYRYNGSMLVAERNSAETIIYIYDASGAVIGMQYRASTYAKGIYDIYWFEKDIPKGIYY